MRELTRTNVMLDTEDKKRLKEKASKQRLSMSSLLRKIILDFLKK